MKQFPKPFTTSVVVFHHIDEIIDHFTSNLTEGYSERNTTNCT